MNVTEFLRPMIEIWLITECTDVVLETSEHYQNFLKYLATQKNSKTAEQMITQKLFSRIVYKIKGVQRIQKAKKELWFYSKASKPEGIAEEIYDR